MMDHMTYSLEPIGFMKSVFHFKNGTPRQSSLCENARGILTIEKSVFNNPEHSLDGLQDFSHAWILFMFHKNNNAHKKAKVKPPRLNGKRVGVFSTRSPYRPNNIGLSLAKIDKIQGAAIYFSGIDILDGTPIIDIKPYIPDYDKPTIGNVSTPPIVNDYSVDETNKTSDHFYDQWKETCQNQCCDESCPCVINSDKLQVSSSQTEGCHRENETLITTSVKSSDDKDLTKCSSLKSQPSTAACDSVEEGFYSLSAALDKARATLRHGFDHRDANCYHKDDEKEPTSLSETLELSHSIAKNVNVMGEVGSRDYEENEEDILDSLVGDVIFRAASNLFFSDNASMKDNVKVLSDDSNSIKSSETPSCSIAKESTVGNLGSRNISAVTAPWLSSPPVTKISVVFSAEALQQLQEFHSNATNLRFRTEMLYDSEDAKRAITSILHEEPRSVYRRQKCQNSLYFFAVDVLHVTCQFDRDVVTVQRIRPVADVPQLQEKERNFEIEKDTRENT